MRGSWLDGALSHGLCTGSNKGGMAGEVRIRRPGEPPFMTMKVLALWESRRAIPPRYDVVAGIIHQNDAWVRGCCVGSVHRIRTLSYRTPDPGVPAWGLEPCAAGILKWIAWWSMATMYGVCAEERPM